MGITLGPGSDLWFTEAGGEVLPLSTSWSGKIDYITTGGTITEVGSDLPNPTGIAAAPHDQLWFTEPTLALNQVSLGEMTTRGAVIQSPGPVSSRTIVLGPDGALWWGSDEPGEPAGTVLKTTPGGQSVVYSDGTPANPNGDLGPPDGFSVGHDGNIWFTAFSDVCKITLGGAITKYPIPNFSPYQTAAGPGGEWFTLQDYSLPAHGKIGKIATNGAITEYGGNLAQPRGIVEGPDGAMWFTESGVASSNGTTGGGKIGRITADGKITEYGGNLLDPDQIVLGPDGNLWFTESGLAPSTGKIGNIVP
jgi:virginiamycin B lyase